VDYDLSKWTTIRVGGPDARGYLDGIITSNVNKPPDSIWMRSMMLSTKGKIHSTFWIQYKDGAFFLVCHPSSRAPLIEDLLKYNLNVAIKLEELSEELPPLVFEEGDKEILATGNLKGEFTWRNANNGGGFSEYLIDKAICPPEFLLGTHPLEMGLLEAISLEKGCFLGQETVSRMYNRGKPRTKLVHVSGENVGEFTRSEGFRILTSSKNSVLAIIPFNHDISEGMQLVGNYPPTHSL